MSDILRSIFVEAVAMMVLGAATALLVRFRSRFASRQPNLAWVPLAIVTALAVAAEVCLAYLQAIKVITYPVTLVLFATPPIATAVGLIIQLRPLWLIGVRGADESTRSGIDYRAALNLCHDHIDFLGTGASKLTKQPNFDQVLAGCRDDQEIRFLLSRPDTASLTNAARRFGLDREEYAGIVLESLRRLAEIKAKRALGHFKVHFYDLPPAFRLMFIDHRLCLVSPMIYGRGDGSQLPQLHVARPNEEHAAESLFHAFEVYFNDLWSHSEPWNFQTYL